IAHGARVIAADLELDMLQHLTVGVPRSVADVFALPFVDGAFAACALAFVLNHVQDPVAALTDCRRVLGPGGVVMASPYAPTRAAAKDVIDQILLDHGWRPPAWYVDLKRSTDAVGTTGGIADVAREAGFAVVEAFEEELDVGLDDPATIVFHRFGVSHI